MRLVIQRVKQAKLQAGSYRAKIGKGLVVLVGFSRKDRVVKKEVVGRVIKKIVGLRIFSDKEGKMNYSIEQVKGEILLIPQFTLWADVKKGYRPFFGEALEPKLAKARFNELAGGFKLVLKDRLQLGKFGAYMVIETVLDGPVTIIMDF